MTTTPPRAETAPIETEALALIRWAHDTLYEINPSNYDHDEVCKLNDASVEVILGLAPILGETHGKTPEWWVSRGAQLAAEVLALRAATTDNTALVRELADMPEDGTWAVLSPGYYGPFTALAIGGEWSMCEMSDLASATHWVPAPCFATPAASQPDLAAENARLREALEWVERHGDCRGEAVQVIAAALRPTVTKEGE